MSSSEAFPSQPKPRRKRKPRPPDPPSQQQLQQAALRYLERFDASEARLRTVLLNRARTANSRLEADERVPLEQVRGWVDDILARYVSAGLVSDRRFAETLVTSCRSRGLGRRAIEARLVQRGVAQQTIRDVLNENEEQEPDAEYLAAQRLVRKRKLGHHRPEAERARNLRRDMGVLARAGFSGDVCRRALRDDGNTEMF